MKVSEFKKGDYIQRTAPTLRTKDHSYVGDRLIFLGFDRGVIFYKSTDGIFGDDVHKLDAFDWDDDNWDYFPEKTYQALLAETADSTKSKQKA